MPQRSGLLRQSGVCPCRHDDDRERGTQSEDSLEDLHAIYSRHHEIEEHEIRRIMLDQRQGIPAVLSEFHAIASGREILLHDGKDRVVIVDDEDTGPSRATVTATSPLQTLDLSQTHANRVADDAGSIRRVELL